MASRFTALPLCSGESFLLQSTHNHREWSILVDSGQRYAGKSHPLVTAIDRAAPGLRRIDIAICTHQDTDHSNGFRTFADAWCRSGKTIGEFWLPGRWAAAVPRILCDPLDVLSRLWSGALTTARRWSTGYSEDPAQADHPRFSKMHMEQRLRDLAPREAISACFGELGCQEERPEALVAEDESGRADHLAQSLGIDQPELEVLQRLLEEVDRPACGTFDIGLPFERPYHPLWWIGDEGLWMRRAAVLFQGAVDTAKTIAAITEAAVSWTIPIRWFDFGLFEQDKCHRAKGGIKGFLEPLCAVELRQPPLVVSDEILFFSLRLSRQNVESLVFFRQETANEPGTLFLGDSRLCFGIDRPAGDFPMPSRIPTRQIVITAPHHGSRVNDEAYRVLNSWLGNNTRTPIYVRNGGHWKQKIDGFLHQTHRRCAQCRQCRKSKLQRRIRLNSPGGNWSLSARDAPKCP